MSLKKYQSKRDFKITPEPPGSVETAAPSKLTFVIQKHQATRLHYDFRLEWDGVLLSWAVPKGPSLDPSVKRLAMPTEDHPLEYGGFEGVIPEDQYGGGTVMVWDKGTWAPEDPDVKGSLRKGELKFTLFGKKLHGSWVLVKTKMGWLLIKHRDRFAASKDILVDRPRSVLSKRLLADIARDGRGDVAKASRADPP